MLTQTTERTLLSETCGLIMEKFGLYSRMFAFILHLFICRSLVHSTRAFILVVRTTLQGRQRVVDFQTPHPWKRRDGGGGAPVFLSAGGKVF